MSRIRLTARLTTVTATLVAPLLLAAPASQAAPEPTTAASTAVSVVSKSTIAFKVDACEGCKLRLIDGSSNARHTWTSSQQKVENGRVSWTIPTKHARDISVTIMAPWEKHTGYVTQVVFHYRGIDRGQHVSVKQARQQDRGSFCFAGPSSDSITVPLTVRRAKVDGTRPHKVDGTLAFATTSRTFVAPYSDTFDGVGGTQDVPVCR